VRKTVHTAGSPKRVNVGVMTALHWAVLEVLGAAGQIDWSRASIDGMHVRAVERGT
jgi:hypothetical protein